MTTITTPSMTPSKMKTITKDEWKTKVHHGYASMIGGTPYILTNEDGRAVLAPVAIEGLEDLEEWERAVLHALLGSEDYDVLLQFEIKEAQHVYRVSGKPCVVVERLWLAPKSQYRYWGYPAETLREYPIPGPHRIVYSVGS